MSHVSKRPLRFQISSLPLANVCLQMCVCSHSRVCGCVLGTAKPDEKGRCLVERYLPTWQATDLSRWQNLMETELRSPDWAECFGWRCCSSYICVSVSECISCPPCCHWAPAMTPHDLDWPGPQPEVWVIHLLLNICCMCFFPNGFDFTSPNILSKRRVHFSGKNVLVYNIFYYSPPKYI